MEGIRVSPRVRSKFETLELFDLIFPASALGGIGKHFENKDDCSIGHTT